MGDGAYQVRENSFRYEEEFPTNLYFMKVVNSGTD